LSHWAIDELKTSTFADEELEEFIAYVVAKADLPFALGTRVNRLTPVGRLVKN